jgi:vanillate O-demethylase ferredoxin subunit
MASCLQEFLQELWIPNTADQLVIFQVHCSMSQQVARQWLSVKVISVREEVQDILSFELADPAGRSLPPFAAGGHIDVEVSDKLIRQYSLCNHPGEQHRYLIAVLKDPGTRGGSLAMHERFKEGDLINISEPKNHFPLATSARKSLLFAGGIGVTPILCMAERLAQTGADFELHYCARSLDRMAFVERIKTSEFANKVSFHLDDGPDVQKLDINRVLSKPQQEVHIYVCGPSGFMDWILKTAQRNQWPEEQVHREYFAAVVQPASLAAGEFEVQIASTGVTYRVPADKSITNLLREHGVDIPTSCEEGVCGTCLTRVIEGEPDHRDLFLTSKERARNDQLLPCCSRAISKKLVLDL